MDITEKQIVESEKIKKYLIKFIRLERNNPKRYYKFYQEVVNDCKLPYGILQQNPKGRTEFGKVLAYLLLTEYKSNRPFLTSIIYGKGLYRPRNGFYDTLITNGIKGNRKSKAKDLYKNLIWRRGLETKAIEYWENDDNYNAYIKIN